MDTYKGFIGDEFNTKVHINENGVRYIVDVKDGQKTGFFLDQKYNRLAIQRICKDAKVLDCFTHTGSFALNAGIAGASSVLGVDASELAIAQAEKMQRSTDWRALSLLSAEMYLIFFLNWNQKANSLTLSYLTRRHSQNQEIQ